MRAGLTKPQSAVLQAITNLTVGNVAPTLAEIADHLGWKSRSTVHLHLSALKKKGRVTWEDAMARSLKVIDDGLPELDPVSEVRIKGAIDESAAALAVMIGTTPAADYVAKVLERLRYQALREKNGARSSGA